MAGPSKVLPTTPHAKKPGVVKDACTSTPGIGFDHEHPRHELNEVVKATLRSVFPESEADPRTRFHEQFQKEADEYDRDFHKKYHDDLNTILIFSGLFSAVASAFIVCVQTQILPDYDQMNFTVLTILLNVTAGVPSDIKIPTPAAPEKGAVEVQAILCSSLASSLLAALIAMLGKQWLNSYTNGSFVDRNRHRGLKMSGMITWRFKLVMESLPFIVETSLLQLGYALARYFWDLSRKVSLTIIGFTAFGLIFYLFVVVAGTVSETCPFRTPLSAFLRTVPTRCGKGIDAIIGGARKFLGIKRSLRGPGRGGLKNPTSSATSGVQDQESGVRADSCCIFTMFEMTKAPKPTAATMEYILEITWDSRLESTPLSQVYRALHESLWYSVNGTISPLPGARERAFLSAKALLHLYLQRRCLHPYDKTLKSQEKLITNQAQRLTSLPSTSPHGATSLAPDSDFDLQSTFYIIDWISGFLPQVPWSDFHLTESHHHWLSHILIYRAWDAIHKNRMLTDDVRGFLQYSLDHDTPDRTVANCLFIIYLVLGHKPDSSELLIKDRSHEASQLIDNIFSKLGGLFEPRMHSESIAKTIEALSSIVLTRDERVGERCFVLFQKVMGLVQNDHRLWQSARLLMKGAFSVVGRMPRATDLKVLLEFLHYHMSSQRRIQFSDEPIYHSFRAIADSPDDHSHQKFAGHFTSPLFIDTMIDALSNRGNKDLQEVAIILLPKLDDHLFTSTFPPGKAQAFVEAWWTAVENCRTRETGRVDRAAAEAFFAIVNSPCLRDNVPSGAWELTDTFHFILESNPTPLQRCTQNPDLLPFVAQTSPKVGRPLWVSMLWMQHDSLPKGVLDQMEEETRRIVYKECEVSGTATMPTRTHHWDSWVGMCDTWLEHWEKKLKQLDPSDPVVSGLRARQQSATRARKRLFEIREEVMRNPPTARLWCES